MGDRTMLGQIFSNLLENAMMYRRKEDPVKIVVDAESDLQTVMARVSDNGIGIAPEFHEKIFDIFQRLQNVDDFPGTGVGLATVRKSARLMGGSVWVESKPGEGSVFFVQLRKG